MLSTEITQLQRRALAHLAAREHPCSVTDLSRELFGAARQDDPVAHLLVRRLLEPLPEVLRTHDRRWALRSTASLAVPLATARFLVVDLESTGSLIGVDRIIEVGLAVLEGGELVRRVSSLVRCRRRLPHRVRHLTGIDPAALASAPPLEEIAGLLREEFARADAFVAHDVGFDYGFLRWELSRDGTPPPALPGVCTLELARRLWPDRDSWRLQDLADGMAIDLEHPHRAGDDATATALVLARELTAAREAGAETLGDLYRLQELLPARPAADRRLRATG